MGRLFLSGFSTRCAVFVEKLSEELVKEFVEECDGMADDLLLFARDHVIASLDNNQLRCVPVGLHEPLAAGHGHDGVLVTVPSIRRRARVIRFFMVLFSFKDGLILGIMQIL